MKNEELWDRIQSVSENVGISSANFYTMKHRKRLASKWVPDIYLELKDTEFQVPLKSLQALTKNQSTNN